MQTMSLRIPHVILEDARLVASRRGKKPAAILRQAMALGLVELRGRERHPAPLEGRERVNKNKPAIVEETA